MPRIRLKFVDTSTPGDGLGGGAADAVDEDGEDGEDGLGENDGDDEDEAGVSEMVC